VLRGVALAATASLSACLGQSDGAGAAAPETITGTIYYEGSAAAPGRPLSIAVYTSFPPSGAPLATQLVESYDFPFHYHFDGLKPGRYYVGALIDVDRADTRYAGMLNRVRDPFGYAAKGAPTELEIDRGAAGADITLEEHRP
jgi:uncharacterized protein (DUF2141 family)